jgi:hypothetical protein
MRELPISACDFSNIANFNLFYADKTKILYQLVAEPVIYLLSRPRRFGKTLLLSTLEHILLGHRELFKGLWIYDSDYDWTPKPVITLEMRVINSSSPEAMEANLSDYIDLIAFNETIKLPKTDLKLKFMALIQHFFEKYKNEVAILVDEYDAPVIKQLKSPPLAEKNREVLAEFYETLKTVNEERGLVFLTGVSRLALTTPFSGLNNLQDLTFDSDYADICGLNASELESLLDERHGRCLEALVARGQMAPGSDIDDLRRLVQDWYGGYSWDGRTRVLNPWSTLSFFQDNTISNFWYSTGTPSFLKKWISSKKKDFDLLKNHVIYESENIIDELDKLKQHIYLFQTGFLTVKEDVTAPGDRASYRLGIPNREVEDSLRSLGLSTGPSKK